DARRYRLARFRAGDRHGAFEQRRGIEMPEEDERVGQRRLAAAAGVAGGTRMGAGALWPGLEDVAEGQRGNAAAARAAGLGVDGVGPQRMARDLHLRFEERP